MLEERHIVIGPDNVNDALDVRLMSCGKQAIGRAINLTARAGRRRSLDDLWAYFQTNVMGTLNFLEVCRKYRVKKFCCPPPPTYMGLASPGPFERTPIANTERPLSPYGASGEEPLVR